MVPTYEVILEDDDGPSITIRDNMDGTAMVDTDGMHGDVEPWSHERIRAMARDLMAVADAVQRNQDDGSGGGR